MENRARFRAGITVVISDAGVLAIVAHPDDETLWCGSSLKFLANCGIRVVALSLTHRDNPVRSVEFRNACDRIGVEHEMLGFEDGGDIDFPEFGEAFERVFERNAKSLGVSPLILTHAPHGNERGHRQHRSSFIRCRNWAHSRSLAFAVFSERALDYQNVHAAESGAPSLFTCEASILLLARDELINLRDSSLAGGGRLARLKRDIFRFRTARGFRRAIRFDVDVAWKNATLAKCYPSQMPGLNDYATAHSRFEWLVFESTDVANALLKRIKCR